MNAPVQHQTLAAAPLAFTPGLQLQCPLAAHWLRQAMLRLRREVAWLWRERALQGVPGSGALPPFVDAAQNALDLARYAQDKQQFFAQDPTARHLGDQIETPPATPAGAAQGSFAWVVAELQLQPVDCFVLALACLPVADSAAAPVLACCMNDAAQTEPTLALAQRLWDAPDELLCRIDPGHPLFSHGLLHFGTAGPPWSAPLRMAAPVAARLLFPQRAPARLLRSLSAAPESAAKPAPGPASLQLTPVLGPAGAPLAEAAAQAAAVHGQGCVTLAPGLSREHLGSAQTLAWLHGCALYLPAAELSLPGGHEPGPPPSLLSALPLRLYLGARDRSELPAWGALLGPPLQLAPLGQAERAALWQQALAARAAPGLDCNELARRLRFEAEDISLAAAQLPPQRAPLVLGDVLAAARSRLDLGALAQPVEPRFALDELMLAPAQAQQMQEMVVALRNLTRSHFEWGTARAWNEGGIAALFAGPPGTGKTMAAEALALALQLPMFRIDLSQVVNKYIGETEKNLRRLFDAADRAEVLLFFDEADSLFGKRTEVKDAHDRYANLEVSYLLERMERFKGLAILATNRKKDLDEAFLRRLRFVLDFSLPGVEERLHIWRACIPAGVDASGLDLPFLAQRFNLAGGHIRAIVFQACLQSAHEGAPKVLGMAAVVRAVQREYAKLERTLTLDQFGPHAPLVAAQLAAQRPTR